MCGGIHRAPLIQALPKTIKYIYALINWSQYNRVENVEIDEFLINFVI